MPDEIKFTVYGRPQQRGSKQAIARYGKDGKPLMKNGRVMTFAKDMNEKSKEWMSLVRDAASEAYGNRELLTDPIVLSAVFWFSRPKAHYGSGRNADKLKPSAPIRHAQSPDLAKLVRCLEDALTGIVWRDDKQVFQYFDIQRRWTMAQERCEVTISSADENSLESALAEEASV